jgi:hypothetical protein
MLVVARIRFAAATSEERSEMTGGCVGSTGGKYSAERYGSAEGLLANSRSDQM